MKIMLRSALALLVAAFALCALSASAALAAPEWGTTGPEWGQGGALLKEAAATKWKGSMQIVDTNWGEAGSGGATVECEEAAEGTVGSGAVGKITAWPMSKCTLVKAGLCTNLEEVAAVDLPWHSEMTLVKVGGGVGIRNKMTQEGKGSPGFKFKCNTQGFGKLTDTCTAATISTNAENKSGGVEATLDDEVKLKCSPGVTEATGSLHGSQEIKSTTGGTLEVLGGSFKALASALEVKSVGVVRLEDTVQKGGIECTMETTGTIGAHSTGTIASLFASKCKPVGTNCGSLSTVESIGLPWSTELFGSLSEVDMRLSSTGEAPGYSFSCTSSPSYTDHCAWPTLSLLNSAGTGDVEERLTSEKTGCSIGGSKAGSWSGSLVVQHPELVEAVRVS